jgi:hypothetical protein
LFLVLLPLFMCCQCVALYSVISVFCPSVVRSSAVFVFYGWAVRGCCVLSVCGSFVGRSCVVRLWLCLLPFFVFCGSAFCRFCVYSSVFGRVCVLRLVLCLGQPCGSFFFSLFAVSTCGSVVGRWGIVSVQSSVFGRLCVLWVGIQPLFVFWVALWFGLGRFLAFCPSVVRFSAVLPFCGSALFRACVLFVSGSVFGRFYVLPASHV